MLAGVTTNEVDAILSNWMFGTALCIKNNKQQADLYLKFLEATHLGNMTSNEYDWTLRFFNGETQRAIANDVGVTPPTVQASIAKALRRCRFRMKNWREQERKKICHS